MKATEDLASCKAAMSTIQKIISNTGTSINEGSFHNQPKGCYVANNKLYFNTDVTDSLNAGSQQICNGKLEDKCHPYLDIKYLKLKIKKQYVNFYFSNVCFVEAQDAMGIRQPIGTAAILFPNVV